MNSKRRKRRYGCLLLVILAGFLAVFLYLTLIFFRPNTTQRPPTPTPNMGTSSVAQRLAEIDQALQDAVSASIAYNVPDTMLLDETVTVELLLNPSVSQEELADEVIESGDVVTSNINITDHMRAELIAQSGGLEVKALENDPVQIISGTETTTWTWFVTAKEEGEQRLSLVIYRLVSVDGKDDWRKIETYRENIDVEVTFGQRLKMLDWKWIGGIVIGMLLIPAFWRWFDNKKKKEDKKSR